MLSIEQIQAQETCLSVMVFKNVDNMDPTPLNGVFIWLEFLKLPVLPEFLGGHQGFVRPLGIVFTNL